MCDRTGQRTCVPGRRKLGVAIRRELDAAAAVHSLASFLWQEEEEANDRSRLGNRTPDRGRCPLRRSDGVDLVMGSPAALGLGRGDRIGPSHDGGHLCFAQFRIDRQLRDTASFLQRVEEPIPARDPISASNPKIATISDFDLFRGLNNGKKNFVHV